VKRPGIFLVASVVLLTLLPWNTAEAQSFKNCAAVKAKYPNGVAINFAVAGRSRAEINRGVYLSNQRLDRDRDGVICENELVQNPSTTTIPLTCAQGGRCGVGDRGPAGGVVFYVSSTTHSWGNVLEAAPLTTSWSGSTALEPLGLSGGWTGPSGRDPLAKWGCPEFSIGGAKARGIGSGAANTRAIIIGCPSSDTGARIADGLVVGGADDWFLPSIDELDLLYRSREFSPISRSGSTCLQRKLMPPMLCWQASMMGARVMALRMGYGLCDQFALSPQVPLTQQLERRLLAQRAHRGACAMLEM